MKVQIDKELFDKCCELFIDNGNVLKPIFDNLGIEWAEAYKIIKNGLESKINAIERRKTYTVYKTGQSDEIKEYARQKYLDMIGMHKDWRY